MSEARSLQKLRRLLASGAEPRAIEQFVVEHDMEHGDESWRSSLSEELEKATAVLLQYVGTSRSRDGDGDEGEEESARKRAKLIVDTTLAQFQAESDYESRLWCLAAAGGGNNGTASSSALQQQLNSPLLQAGQFTAGVLRKHSARTGEDCRFGGHEALLLQQMLSVAARAGLPVAAEHLKLSNGVELPPRAARMGSTALRSLSGLLDSLLTEGTCSTLPESPPAGLSVSLKEYQLESLGWMRARERGRAGMEDLFETRIGRTCLSVLPADGDVSMCVLSDRPEQPRHFGGILAEEMGLGKSARPAAGLEPALSPLI